MKNKVDNLSENDLFNKLMESVPKAAIDELQRLELIKVSLKLKKNDVKIILRQCQKMLENYDSSK